MQVSDEIAGELRPLRGRYHFLLRTVALSRLLEEARVQAALEPGARRYGWEHMTPEHLRDVEAAYAHRVDSVLARYPELYDQVMHYPADALDAGI